MTAAEALRLAVPRLRSAGVEGAARDARVLLAHALGVAADRLTLHLGDALTAPQAQAYAASLAARAARQPVSQIIGERLFMGRAFRVTRDVLDPRPETETLVLEGLRRPFGSVLDLGTGSGCILISLLLERPGALGLGIDISAAALRVAAENRARHGLEGRAELCEGNWFQGLEGRRFDLILSNPPYIAAEEIPDLAPEIRQWEPPVALTPGGDGLAAYRAIAATAARHLVPGGRLLVEIGPTQGQAVSGLFAAGGLAEIRILPDLDGRDRVVAAAAPDV